TSATVVPSTENSRPASFGKNRHRWLVSSTVGTRAGYARTGPAARSRSPGAPCYAPFEMGGAKPDYGQQEQMEHPTMVGTLAAQIEMIWPLEKPLLERLGLPAARRVVDL